jgi:TPR repeat protein
MAKAAADAYEASEEFKKGNFAGVINACEAAAKTGNASCQIFLGILYSEGKGVKADPVAAARWFRLAAEQGNPVGALNLGLAYERGTGVPKDMRRSGTRSRRRRASPTDNCGSRLS